MAALTDAKVRAAKPGDKAYKLSAGEQLYLHVSPTGGRHWRMNYQFGRNDQGRPRQKTLTIGRYPAISLKDARQARDEAKALLARGIEPKPDDLLSRKRDDGGPTFESAGREWYAIQLPRWSRVHGADVLGSLESEVFPRIGQCALTSIDAPAVLGVLQAVSGRGAIETSHRLRQRISAIFVYGIAMGYCANDPAASLSIALPRKPKARSQPAITDLAALRQLLVDCDAERCRLPTKLALRLLALTAVRPGELHGARWSEFEGLDGDEPLWRIPASRMKGDKDRKAQSNGDHLVPLAPQSVAIIELMEQLTGDLELVFPSDRHPHRPMSENTLRALLIRAGYYQRHVPHGFRSAFSTIMNERARAMNQAEDRAIIDLMLAHIPPNKVESAYNRASYMPRRRELACEWADMLLADMWPPSIHIGQPIRWASSGPGKPRA